MLLIKNAQALARALDSPIEATLKRLLTTRRDQLLKDTDDEYDIGDLAHFIVVEPPDSVADIEAGADYPLITSAAFEWVADHGGWYEAVTILSDDGFGIALFVPYRDDIDSAVLTLLRDQAVQPIAPVSSV